MNRTNSGVDLIESLLVHNHLPYVGIPASDMIKKLNIHFVSTQHGLKKVDEFTHQFNEVNDYERKLFHQSEWEKNGYGVF